MISTRTILPTPEKLLREGQSSLHSAQVENADNEALWLLAATVGKNWMTALAVSKENAALYRSRIERRCRHEPLAYILQSQPFMEREFYVDPSVLIPRPETEILVREALRFLQSQARPLRVLDLGTGSGIIALSLAAECAEPLEIWALDRSREALSVAQGNARRFHLEERIRWLESDLFKAVPKSLRFDCLCANLPYVPESDWTSLAPEVRQEPRSALLSGPEGLNAIGRAIETMLPHLNAGAATFWEVGILQAQKVEEMLQISDDMETEIFTDARGIARVVKGIRHG